MGATSLIDNNSDSGIPHAKVVRNHLTGDGISYEWQQGGQREKAEIYAVDVPALIAAFDRSAKSGKRGFDLVNAVFGAQMSNITCVALFNEKGFSDNLDGTAAIRHFYPGSGRMFLAEHWRDGEYLFGVRAEESNQNSPPQAQAKLSV